MGTEEAEAPSAAPGDSGQRRPPCPSGGPREKVPTSRSVLLRQSLRSDWELRDGEGAWPAGVGRRAPPPGGPSQWGCRRESRTEGVGQAGVARTGPLCPRLGLAGERGAERGA